VPLLAANPKYMLADKGYDIDDVCSDVPTKGILSAIPRRVDCTILIACDVSIYRLRNSTERMFNSTKQLRRVAARFDKTATFYLGFLLWPPRVSDCRFGQQELGCILGR
jgi:transposase